MDAGCRIMRNIVTGVCDAITVTIKSAILYCLLERKSRDSPVTGNVPLTFKFVADAFWFVAVTLRDPPSDRGRLDRDKAHQEHDGRE